MPFEARPLPEMIDVGGEMVAGPFCVHCGYPFSLHGPHMLCPVVPNALMGPACDCHVIQNVEVKVGRVKTTARRIVRVQ